MNEKEFIDCIRVDDCIKIYQNLQNLNQIQPSKVYILCEKTIVNYPYINIRNLINGSISESDKMLIKGSPLKFNFKLNEIIELNKAKKEIFIVNKAFLLKMRVNNIGENPCLLYKINSKKILYFVKEFNAIEIESKNKNILSNHPQNNININNINPMNNIVSNNPSNITTNELNNIINNNINKSLNNNINNSLNINKNLNPNLNNQKSEIILNSLILLYANSKEMNRIFSINIHENYNSKKYVLINKGWIDDIKNYFNYNEINNLLSQEKFKFNIYDDYKNSLGYLNTLPEFKNIKAKFANNSLTQFNQNKTGTTEKIHPQLNIKIPLPFELINVSLFNLIKQYIPNINEHQLNYNVVFGYSTLYLQSKKALNIIYAYIYDNINKKFILFAICILEDAALIKGIFDKYLNNMAFKDYLIIKNLKLNLLNQKQNIIGSNGSKQADVILTYQIDQIGQVNQINQANQFDQINQFNQNNPVFQNNQIINENNEMNQNNKPTDLNQKNENKNIGNLQNEKNIFNANYSIYKNFKNFLQELKNLKDENIENLMFNGIETDLNYKIITNIPVYLIETEKFNYLIETLNFKSFYQLENTNDESLKNNLKIQIIKNKCDLDSIYSYIEIVSINNIIENKLYSFLNEKFFKELKFPLEKYKNKEGLIFRNKRKIFLYNMNSKILLTFFQDNKINAFKLSKMIFNNN